MPRPPIIEEEDVANAVRELRENGKPINPYQIKKLIGQGSEAKIAQYLQAMDVNYDLDEEDPLTKRLTNLVRPIALELNEQKLKQVAEIRNNHALELRDKTEHIASVTAKLRERDKKIERLSADLVDSEAKFDALVARLKESEDRYNDLRLELKGEQSAHNETSIKLESSMDTIASLKQTADKNDALYNRHLEELRATHHNDLSQRDISIANLESEVSSVKKAYEEALHVISKIQDESTSKDSEIRSLSERAENLQNKSNELASQLQNKEEELYSIKTSQNDQAMQITDQGRKIETQKIEIQQLRQQLSNASDTIAELKQHTSDVSKEKSNLQAQYEVLESVIDKLKLFNKGDGLN